MKTCFKGAFFLFFGMISIIINSCYSKKDIYIEVMKPSPVSYKAPIAAILTWNNSDSEDNFYDSLALSWLHGFKYSLEKNLWVDTILIRDNANTNISPIFYNAIDFLVTLEDIKIVNKQQTEQLIMNNVIKDKNSEIILRRVTIDYYIDWVITDKNSEKILHESFDTERFICPAETSSNDSAGEEIPGYQFQVTSLFNGEGRNASRVLFPNWEPENRCFYTSGKSGWVLAEYYTTVNQWRKAAEIWSREVHSPFRTAAKYSTYNMALACEMEGKLEAAIYWAEKSAMENFNSRANRYLKILKRRLEDQQKLKEQIGN